MRTSSQMGRDVESKTYLALQSCHTQQGMEREQSCDPHTSEMEAELGERKTTASGEIECHRRWASTKQ